MLPILSFILKNKMLIPPEL